MKEEKGAEKTRDMLAEIAKSQSEWAGEVYRLLVLSDVEKNGIPESNYAVDDLLRRARYMQEQMTRDLYSVMAEQAQGVLQRVGEAIERAQEKAMQEAEENHGEKKSARAKKRLKDDTWN